VPKLRKVSGKKVIGILCNKMGFEISGRSGSHVRLSKITPEGKVGTVQTQSNKLQAQLCGFLYC
jgi:predicted RNA binding protein YcfA (HicA-like mRNA interferase family)